MKNLFNNLKKLFQKFTKKEEDDILLVVSEVETNELSHYSYPEVAIRQIFGVDEGKITYNDVDSNEQVKENAKEEASEGFSIYKEKLTKRLNFNQTVYRNICGQKFYSSPVGYCMLNAHRGFISKTNSITHKCFTKGCKYFIPNTSSTIYQNKKSNIIETDCGIKEITMQNYQRFVKKLYYSGDINRETYLQFNNVTKNNYMNYYEQLKRFSELKNKKEVA